MPPSTQTSSSPLSNRPENSWRLGPRYVNVLLCSLATFLVLAAPAVLMPVLYGAIMNETGWNYSQVTSFSSMKFASGALTSLLIGLYVLRLRGKTIMLVGVLTSGFGLLCLSLPMSLPLFHVLGLVLGVSSITTALACKIILSNWFRNRLGRATGLAFLGGSFGGVALPIIGVALLDQLGWQLTAAVFGLGVLLVVAPLIAMFLKERPEDEEGPASAAADIDSPEPADFPLVGSRTFWLILGAQFLVGFVDQGLIAHTPLYLERDAGLGLSVAAVGTSTMMLAGVVGKLGFGFLYDRMGMRGVAACWWLLALGSLAGLGVVGAATMTAFVVLRGMAHGGALITAPSIALLNFPGRNAARVICFLSVASMIGAGTGTSLIALLRDMTGSYNVPILLLGLLALVAGTIACCIRPTKVQEGS